jgi:hypothetical protein
MGGGGADGVCILHLAAGFLPAPRQLESERQIRGKRQAQERSQKIRRLSAGTKEELRP